VPDKPLVSCIIPVFNGARFLADAVDSVERQTYAPIEIIIVDDGSTDDTPGVIDAFGERVRAIRQDNSGPSAARNRGILAARGEFIAFLDSDDVWVPEKVERQVACFLADSELDLCTSQLEHFWAEEVAEEEEQLQATLDRPRPTGWFNTAMARRGLFDRIGLLDDSLRHLDSAEFMMRVEATKSKLCVLPDRLMRRRLHLNNLSRNRRDEEARERLQLVQARMQQMRRSG